MKTTTTNQKNNFKKLTKVLGIGMLMSFGIEANSQCVADFTYVTDSVNNGNVIFTNTTSNGNSTFSWDFGDGIYSNLENPNHNFINMGTSTVVVCLTVSNPNGITCTYCDSVSIGHYPTPSPCQAYFYSEADFNSINGINFMHYSGGTPSSFLWEFGDGTTSNLENPHHIFAHAGTYQVCLTIIDQTNNCQNTYCDNIIVGIQPGGGCQAYFYSEPDFNSVNGIHFWNYTGGTASTYHWEFGDSTTSTAENPHHIFAHTGAYEVCLTVTDSVGTTCSYCEHVYVGQNGNGCEAYFYSHPGNDSVNSINFVNYFSGSNTYSWNFGDGTASTLENPNHIFANPGEYLVCLTIADSNGTTCTYCEYVYEGGHVEECQAYFYSSPDSSSETSINFLNYSTGLSSAYSWDFGDNTTSNLENPNHVYAHTGVYQVCLTIADSTGSSCSFCENVVVGNDGCQAYFYSDIDSISGDGSIDFSNYSGGAPGSYFWDFGDSTTTSNLGNPNHVYADTGTYYACLTVIGQDGTTCTYCDSVTAQPMMIAGIKESKKVNTLLENYPNPFHGSTTINYTISKNAIVELIVVDLLGNKVAAIENGNKSAGKYSTVWNVEDVTPGMYLIQMRVNNEISSKKIIITK